MTTPLDSRMPATGEAVTPERVQEELQRQPHLFMRLAENALRVAESLRGNYFQNTATFISHLRRSLAANQAGLRAEPIMKVCSIQDVSWAEVAHEVVTFIDGGVGQVELAGQTPILLRVGSYRVKSGERELSEREQFGYYPVILGDLEGGSRERKDFVDIVRITAELLAALSAVERMQDLRVLMVHGPLVYTVWHYMGHAPFTEHDVDLFLRQYAPDERLGRTLKEDFLREAQAHYYPAMTDRWDEWCRRRLFEPLAFMAFLLRRLIETARRRSPPVLLIGVVERGDLSDFSERYLLRRVFDGLRRKGHADYFNKMYGRTDLTSERALLDRLGYTDALLMAMLLQPGQYSESWAIDKYSGFRRGLVSLPGVPGEESVRYEALRSEPWGFPAVRACYLHVSETTEPLRVELFDALAEEQLDAALRRTYLYARLLPGYGFPVGLDIADKFAHVPNWLTDAYGKLIRYQLAVSLQEGRVSDAEMRRILVQAIYMTHRDWLFRPDP